MNQQLLLNDDFSDEWKKHWKAMPVYSHSDLMPWRSIVVHMEGPADIRIIEEVLKCKITPETKVVWAKPQSKLSNIKYQWFGPKGVQPKYPIYIISKGRWESRKTAKALDLMVCNYRMVVEPQEYSNYAEVIDPAKILTLPFSNLGQGSIPARNWVWEHSISEGHKRHWILDDNIAGFMRFHNNRKLMARTPAIFCAAENFVDRYVNLPMASFHYDFFAINRKHYHPAFLLNSRCYSCILLDNSISHRWRGRYNEDTDLSLRILKDGLCTAQFYAFLQMKETTMTMKGGNSDELYAGDGRLKMAESLVEQHPDRCTITEKWNRKQHLVDYSGFKQRLILAADPPPESPDEFGMVLKEVQTGEDL